MEDENDNIPTIPSELTLCQEDGVLGSVVVVAEDKDQSPFSSPFAFSLPNNNDGTWSVKSLNGKWLSLYTMKRKVYLFNQMWTKIFFLQMFVVPYVQRDPKSDMVSFQWWEKKQICEGVVELFCFTTLWILGFQK